MAVLVPAFFYCHADKKAFVMSVFFELLIYNFIPYNYYLVYLHKNYMSYGKGYTRTSFIYIGGYKEKGLVLQQHIGGLYRIYTGTSGCNTQLLASCRTVW